MGSQTCPDHAGRSDPSTNRCLVATIPSMQGDGFYDRNSQVQEQFILSSADLLNQAAAAVPLPAQGTVGLADLGCSEGKNSLLLMRHLVDQIRARAPHQALQVVHNDLPANNFNQLFQHLYRQADPYGPNSWALASASSFFQPIVPAATLHIACCFSAAHWMSQLPPLPDPSGLLFARMQPPSRALMAAQAAQDWDRFLAARAQELVPGGRLVVVMGGRQGEQVAGLKMYAVLDQILTELQHPPFVMPIYYRSREEILEPLAKNQFRLELLRVQHIPTPFAQQLQLDGDRLAYARATTGFVRAWMEPLLPDARIYERMQERMQADPHGTEVANVQIVAAFSRL